MKSRRILAALLSALMLAPAIVSCSESTDNAASSDNATAADTNGDVASEVVEEAAEEEEVVTDDLPERDYDGYSYNIYTRSNTTHYLFLAEELTGEVLNDAIYERNLKIADRFNVVFTETEYSDEGLAASNVVSGDDTFSLMNVRCTAADTMAQKHYCLDMSSFQYINLSKPYWDEELTEAIAVGSRKYAAIGSANLTTIDFMTALLFNKDILTNYGLDDPYTLVLEGKWTFDRYGEMAAAASQDINGDGTMNEDDQWGIIGCAKLTQCSFIQAGDAMYITKDENGYPVYDMGENEHFIDVYTKIFEIFNDNGAWYATTDDTNEQTTFCSMFREGKSLFFSLLFYYIESMRDMETEFGILPYPKYDEAQTEYRNRITFFDTTVIPVTVADQERTTIVYEALTCESFNSVVPAYYEIALKSKYSRDEQSSAMLDIIMENRVLDFGDTYFVGTIRDSFVANNYINNNRDIVSNFNKTKKVVGKQIDKMIAAYESTEE